MSHSKAKHHHKKAGEALDKGDVQMAMHHTGHVLSALRHGERSSALSATPAAAAPGRTATAMIPDADPPVAPASPFGGMRGRLSKMKPPA